MTDYKADPDWDLDSSPVSTARPDDPLDGSPWDQESQYWDLEQEWDWDSYPVQPPPPPSPPWFRSPRLLLALIGCAAAMLVVATALLVGGRFGGQIPTSPQLNSRTPSPTSTVNSAPVRAPSRTSAAPSTSESPKTLVETPAEQPETPQSAEQGPPPPPPPPAQEGPAQAPKRSSGPRINVTRTPMSFAPTVSARP